MTPERISLTLALALGPFIPSRLSFNMVQLEAIVFILTIVSHGLASAILDYAYVDHIVCKVNKDYCPNYTCKLSFISRKEKSLTWSCELTKAVDQIYVQVTLYYRYRAGYKKFLIDLNIDVCAYYTNSIGNALMDLVRESLKKYSTNLVHPCPFSGNISLVGLPLTSSLVNNIFLPAGEYKLVMGTRITEDKIFGVTITIYISVPAGRTIEDDRMG